MHRSMLYASACVMNDNTVPKATVQQRMHVVYIAKCT